MEVHRGNSLLQALSMFPAFCFRKLEVANLPSVVMDVTASL